MGRVLTPRGYGDTITEDHNEIYLTDSQDQKKAKLEQWIAKKIGEVLVKNFPNRQWKVIVDLPGQMLIVACDSISNEKGYHIKMAHRNIEELQRRSIFAASEILERHNITRNRKFDADIIETLPRDTKDNVIASDSAPEPIDGN